jgi:uncharacterized protein YkwD
VARLRQASILFLALIASFLLLLSGAPGFGQEPQQAPDLTPTIFVRIPLVAQSSIALSPGAPTPIPPDDLGKEQEVAELINQHRRANGLPAVTLISELTQAARRHSRDMADNNLTSHTGADGSTPGQRIQEAGYDWVAWGEIIAWGYGGDPERVVNGWMDDQPHKDIILSSSYQDFGVGYAVNPGSDWGHYWTVDFGKRATRGTVFSRLYICTSVFQGEQGGGSLMLYSMEPCQ